MIAMNELEKVLAEHTIRWIRPYVAECSCGRWGETVAAEAGFRTHLASCIRASLET